MVRALDAGEPEAFAALYDRLGDGLYRVAATLLGSKADAEDAVHDLFVDLVRSRHSLARAADLDAYVFACLRHLLVRRAARRNRERELLAARGPAVAETAWPRADDEELEIALRGLPSEQREVITLKFQADLTFAQIGTVLGIPQNTAASRYRYGIEKLRGALGVAGARDE